MTYLLELRSIVEEEHEENQVEQFDANDESFFKSLIEAIKLNMPGTVAHILTEFNNKPLSVITSFNHPDIVSNDEIRKTLVIIAVEFNAHECLKILMKYVLEHHADQCQSLLNFYMPDYDQEYTALDILLYESSYAKYLSPIDKLKKSINLLMAQCQTVLDYSSILVIT